MHPWRTSCKCLGDIQQRLKQVCSRPLWSGLHNTPKKLSILFYCCIQRRDQSGKSSFIFDEIFLCYIHLPWLTFLQSQSLFELSPCPSSTRLLIKIRKRLDMNACEFGQDKRMCNFLQTQSPLVREQFTHTLAKSSVLIVFLFYIYIYIYVCQIKTHKKLNAFWISTRQNNANFRHTLPLTKQQTDITDISCFISVCRFVKGTLC